MPRYTDLFLYNYSKKNRVLRRLTETQYANETQPIEYSPNVISYLCDENGITNRYIARFDSAISFIDTITHYRYFTKSFPITNYSRSIIEHDINSRSKKYAEIIYKDGLYIMYMDNLILAGNLNPVPVKNTYYVDQLRQSDIPVEESLEKPVEEKKKQKRKRLQNVHIGDIRRTKTDTNKIDIDNYTFREIIDVSGEGGKGDSLKTILQRKKKKFSMPKKRNYNVEYSINQMVSQVDFSFLNSSYQQFTGGGAPIYLNPGFNAFIKIGITDLMEDYRITGGVRLSVNLDNNEYLLSYDDLKNRLDKQIVFHRTSMKNFTDDYISRQHTHELHYILKWPFDQVISARGAFILRNDRTSFLSSDLKNLIKDDIDKNWAGVKGEIVYDNTRNIGLNLYFGTRYKIFGEYYQLIDQNQKNLIVIGLDYRKYTKIHRTCIWANRIAASTSFGNSRLIYYMGGVDNWLFPKFNNSTPISQEQHYTYQTLATNMRGFHQNIRNGNSFFVINSEIRFPVFRYFSNKPLKSDFFNNFQIIGFGDLGTAWTGTDPYSKENSLFTQVIPGHPITVTIEKQIEPIVGGYGFGLRSRLIGYFLRADWAWGYEDGYPQPMVFYLSMSLDF